MILPAPPRQHDARRLDRAEHRTEKIGVEGFHPVLLVRFEKGRRRRGAGVVDENVDPPVGLVCRGKQVFDLAGNGQVGLHKDGLAPGLLDFIGDRFAAGPIRPGMDDDPDTVPGKLQGNGAADVGR